MALDIDKESVNSSRNTITSGANAVEDLFKALLKLLDEKEAYLRDKDFLTAMKNQSKDKFNQK